MTEVWIPCPKCDARGCGPCFWYGQLKRMKKEKMSKIQLCEEIAVWYPVEQKEYVFEKGVFLNARVEEKNKTVWLDCAYGEYPISINDARIASMQL